MVQKSKFFSENFPVFKAKMCHLAYMFPAEPTAEIICVPASVHT